MGTDTTLRVAVTGGAGFIGQQVVDIAEELGHEVFVFDRRYGLDVREELWSLGNFRAQAVIHLAGILGTSELFDYADLAVDINVKGTLNILRWCHDNDARYVGITMPPVFPSVYTATKICADRLATAWHHSRGVPVSKVRAFNAYGPGQKHGQDHPQKILPTFATEAWRNRPIPIWGDGTQTVDLVHVSDLALMLVMAMEFGDDETFDGGTGTAVTVNELAEFVIKMTGSTAGINYLPMRDGEIPTKIVASGEGWDKMNYRPVLDWSKVRDAVDWYKPND